MPASPERIAIARVILKDAPILVLDEATSALDSEVEAAIQSQLGSLMEGQTVIATAGERRFAGGGASSPDEPHLS